MVCEEIIFKQNTISDICGLRSHSFQTTTVLNITPNDNASMQDLVLQDHKLKTLGDLFPLQQGHLACRI